MLDERGVWNVFLIVGLFFIIKFFEIYIILYYVFYKLA